MYSLPWLDDYKGTTCFICVSRPVHALISASGEKRKRKNFKENPYLWTSSRGQVLSSAVAEKETDCSTQTTVLWRLMEKVNLLVSKLFLAVDSIALQNESRSRRSRLPGVSLLLEHGSSWGTHHGGFRDNFRGEVPKKVFLCVIAVVGKTLILTEKKELEVLPSLDHSLAHVCSPCRWVRAHCHGLERGRAISKKRQKRSSGHPLLLFFFAALQDGGLLEMSCLSSMVPSMVPLGERFLTITFRIWSVKYCVYFLVVCLLFPRSRIDFQKKLDEKLKKQTSCPKHYSVLYEVQTTQPVKLIGGIRRPSDWFQLVLTELDSSI